MPPLRTIPPAKAIKTERTHEENQERAYIAASRRSDRSLEARVESARRASEIHKRRTGRSLRVTEQDVINEEMYEEEDDDLPIQYRRLTAHLQTGSVDFNRRLADYLTNQVAMRSAMDHMINSSFSQQYPNAPQFAHNNHNNFPSPMTNQNMVRSPSMASPQSVPYPSPHQAGFRQQTHGRAYSMASLAEYNGHPTPQSPASRQSLEHRRTPKPAPLASPCGGQSLSTEGIKPDPDQQRQTQSAGDMSHFWQTTSPFTTSLPPESQQMLGPALDMNNPYHSMLMAGSEPFAQSQYYPWVNMQDFSKQSQSPPMFSHPSYNGMSATLAPSALDTGGDSLSVTTTSGTTPGDTSAPSSGLDFNFSQDSSNLKGISGLTREHSTNGMCSGQLTPGELFWDNFVQDGSWGEETAN